MTGSVLRTRRPGGGPRTALPVAGRSLAVLGALAACAVAGTGLVLLVLLVVTGWMAAPHAGLGLTGVLRTAATVWLIGNHVGFVLAGTGRIGMLPLGLVLLPGALLWRAGRWVVRASGAVRLRQVGAAALAIAVPYAALAVALAAACRSARAAPSVPQAAVACFLLALAAAGLGGARALAPWGQLTGLLPARLRSVILGTTAAVAVLAAAGAALGGASLASHLGRFGSVNEALTPGAVGAALLLVAQIGYVPNAVIWAISFTLGPGFAFGTGTVVARPALRSGRCLPSPCSRRCLPGCIPRCRRRCRLRCSPCPTPRECSGACLSPGRRRRPRLRSRQCGASAAGC